MLGWISLTLLAGSLGTYLLGRRLGVAGTLVCLTPWGLWCFGQGLPWMVPWTACVAGAVVLLAGEFRDTHRESRAACDSIRQHYEAKAANTLADRQMIENANRQLETQVFQMTSLYTMSKTLSGSLGFEAVMSTFGDFIVKHVRFARCRLMLCDASGQVARVGERMTDSATAVVRDPTPEEQELAASLAHTTGPVSAGIGRDLSAGAVTMGRLPFVSIPLLVEKQSSGFLMAEDVEPEGYRRLVGFASQLSLAMQRSKLYALVQTLATTDGLTGLAVRRHVLERLEEECRRAARLRHPLSVVMIDLDHFKSINDTYGHLVGDTVLRIVATRIAGAIREIDLAGRYGGEEFIVVLSSTEKHAARQVAARIHGFIADTPIEAYDESLLVTASVGVTTVEKDSVTSEQVIGRADRALYAAKEGGRNRVVVFDELPDQGASA